MTLVAGFWAFDPGQTVPKVSITDRLTSILGTITTNGVNGSRQVPEFALGRPFYMSLNLANTESIYAPVITISGTTLSWAYQRNIRPSLTFMYGVY